MIHDVRQGDLWVQGFSGARVRGLDEALQPT
jgi:hypothetical protein